MPNKRKTPRVSLRRPMYEPFIKRKSGRIVRVSNYPILGQGNYYVTGDNAHYIALVAATFVKNTRRQRHG